MQHRPRRSVAERLTRCAIQWRAWLGEARRTGRGFVADRPCIDPLKRRHGCREYGEYHHNSEKHDGGAVIDLSARGGRASSVSSVATTVVRCSRP